MAFINFSSDVKDYPKIVQKNNESTTQYDIESLIYYLINDANKSNLPFIKELLEIKKEELELKKMELKIRQQELEIKEKEFMLKNKDVKTPEEKATHHSDLITTRRKNCTVLYRC